MARFGHKIYFKPCKTLERCWAFELLDPEEALRVCTTAFFDFNAGVSRSPALQPLGCPFRPPPLHAYCQGEL